MWDIHGVQSANMQSDVRICTSVKLTVWDKQRVRADFYRSANMMNGNVYKG